jgi:subtilase family serine protease
VRGLIPLIIVATAGPLFGQTPGINNGLAYLRSTQSPDGSWGATASSITDIIPATETVVETLRLLESTPSSQQLLGRTFLSNQILLETDYIARRILALAGTTSFIASDQTILLSIQNKPGGVSFASDNGWGGLAGHGSTILDSSLALQAFTAVHYTDAAVIAPSLGYLVNTQNPDGGWGFVVGNRSQTYTTALALKALSGYASQYNLNTPIQNAVNYLLTHQTAPGHWENTVYLTALVYKSLVASGADLSIVGPAVANYLIGQQLPNGSWNEDPYATALALQALNGVKPNLTLTSADVTLSPLRPAAGAPLTFSVSVHNRGASAASSGTIAAYDGDPSTGGRLIQTATLPQIAPGETATAVLVWEAPSAGRHPVYFAIDPDQIIAETDESDNRLLLPITLGAATDLSVSAGDFSSAPIYPTANAPVTLTANIYNLGAAEVAAAEVAFYNGHPETGGILLGTVTVMSLPPGGFSPAMLSTSFAAPGTYPIHVVIDPAGRLPDTDRTNNRAAAALNVVPEGIDLVITESDLAASPPSVNEGEEVTVTATIRNLGVEPSGPFAVRFNIFNPINGLPGPAIGADQPVTDLPPGQSVSLSATVDTAGYRGGIQIVAQADIDGRVAEANKTNNAAQIVIPVFVPNSPDFDIQFSDIQFDLAIPLVGQPDNLTITVRNKGPMSGTGIIKIYEGDPKLSGTLLGTYSRSIDAGQSNVIQQPWIYPGGNPVISVLIESITSQDYNTFNNQATRSSKSLVKGIINPGTTSDGAAVPSSPMVGDIDRDGIAEIVFGNSAGDLTAVRMRPDGSTETVWTVHLGGRVYTPSLGTLTAGGTPKIVVFTSAENGKVVALNADGTLFWQTVTDTPITPTGLWYAGPYDVDINPVFSDLDGDGNTDIVVPVALNGSNTSPVVLIGLDGSTGQIRFKTPINTYYIGFSGDWMVTAIFDFMGPPSDPTILDGLPEIVVGKARELYIFDNNGRLRHQLPGGPFGVVDLDVDGKPEIATNYEYLRIYDSTLRERWRYSVGCNFAGSMVLADFIQSGAPQIFIAERPGCQYAFMFNLLDKDGRRLYQTPIFPSANNSAFSRLMAVDFNGDGREEIVIVSSRSVLGMDAATGGIVWDTGLKIATAMRSSVAADLDGDGHVELLVPAVSQTDQALTPKIFILGDEGWAAARSVWNQLFYFPGRVKSDLTLTHHPRPWELSNTWQVQSTEQLRLDQPDPAVEPTGISFSNAQPGQGEPISVTVSIKNRGSVEATNLPIALYDGDPARGGILIGRASMPSLPANGEQIVTFDWIATLAGSHSLSVVIDPNKITPDADRTNNEAVRSLFVALPSAPEAGVDLAVASSEITVAPNALTEGETATLRALIRNINTLPASDVDVAFYQGDPDSGGTPLGSVQIGSLAGGETVTVSLPWNTLGASGGNYLYVIIDPGNAILERTKSNNKGFTFAEVVSPSLPDLAISVEEIHADPAAPIEGDLLTISATLRNLGSAVGEIPVAFYDGDRNAGGRLLAIQTIQTRLPLGATATLQQPVVTTGHAGATDLFVVIDPGNTLNERTRTNNQAAASLFIQPSRISLSLSTDRTSYGAKSEVMITPGVTNGAGADRNITLDLFIEDGVGNQIAAITTGQALHLGAESSTALSAGWNTGRTLAGSYRAHARLMEVGRVIAESFSSFAIVSAPQAAATIVPDKVAYASNEAVTLTSTVISQTVNDILSNLTATVRLTDPTGGLFFTESKPMADLLPEGSAGFKSFADTGTAPAGMYTATLEIESGGNLLTTATATFEILGSLAQAAALSGEIAADPPRILERENTTLTFTVRNIGNEIDLPLIETAILIVDPDTETPVTTLPGEVSLNGREVFTDQILLESGALLPKPYLIVLQGSTAGITQTLGSAGLQIDPVPNHAPMANAGADRLGLTGQPALLDGSASADPDGDPLTFTWHFLSVPSTSQITDAALANATTPAPSFVPDVDGIYTLGLTVSDGLVSSPQDTVSVFVNPAPEVDLHPETINLKSNGGSKSITAVLTSPLLSPFSFFTAEDGITVTASFALENRYVDQNGNSVVFTVAADDYPGDDAVVPVDADGNGTIDFYQLTLKFNRDGIIAGFKDANGNLRITQPTSLTSTVIGNEIPIGSDTNTVIAPPGVSGGK